MIRLAVIAALLCAAANAAGGEIYKCTENGRVTYSERPCSGTKPQAKVPQETPPPQVAAPPTIVAPVTESMTAAEIQARHYLETERRRALEDPQTRTPSPQATRPAQVPARQKPSATTTNAQTDDELRHGGAWLMGIFTIIIMGLISLYLTNLNTSRRRQGTANAPITSDNHEATKIGEAAMATMKRTMAILEAAIAQCHDEHPHAAAALFFMAGSDGSISRNELRIILGFCERQGTAIGGEWQTAQDHVNAGIKIQTTDNPASVEQHIAALAAKPIAYRAAFLGAIEAINASSKTSSPTKRRILERAQALV